MNNIDYRVIKIIRLDSNTYKVKIMYLPNYPEATMSYRGKEIFILTENRGSPNPEQTLKRGVVILKIFQ